nr:zinc-dependent alcohol dehydrogenase family protein [Woeseiaceae bacterium]
MTMQTAKAVRFHRTGDASVLELEDHALVEPGPGEVRIIVEAIGLNRAEIMFREGQYLETPEFPSKLGYEASGVIDALGAGVDDFSIGERVSSVPAFSMGQYGVYGESAILPASAVARYDESLSPIEGTSIWMPYVTAYGLLVEVGGLKRGQVVLITAASSSVGVAAIQIAKAEGATVIAATRGVEKKRSISDVGADYVIATDENKLAESVMEL